MLLGGSQRSRMLQHLADRGLVSWGDLSCCPRGAVRRWLPPALIEHLLTFASGTPGDCPPHFHPPPRVGQFWLLKGTAQDQGDIYRIDALPAHPSPHYVVRHWTGGEGHQWRPMPHIGQWISASGRPEPLSVADLMSRCYQRIMVHLPRLHLVGTILATFPDSIQTPAPPPTHWARLDPSVHWRIYVDGAWGPSPTPTIENYFWDGNSHAGGAASSLWPRSGHRSLSSPSQPNRSPRTKTASGSPFMMELLALTGTLQLLAHLQLRGTVCSDCQGLIRKLQQRNVFRCNTTSPGFPLLRDCKRMIASTRSIQWIKVHPERSQTPQSGWSQDQWGNYIADHYARLPHTPSALNLPTLTPTVGHHVFDRLALRHQHPVPPPRQSPQRHPPRYVM